MDMSDDGLAACPDSFGALFPPGKTTSFVASPAT